MNITIDNYFNAAQHIGWQVVPASLKKVHEALIPDASKDNWAAFHRDEDVRRVVEKYFSHILKYVPLSKIAVLQKDKKKPAAKPQEDEKAEALKAAAREVAAELIRHYVLRGDSLESIRKSWLGAGDDNGSAQIRNNKIIVSRVRKTEVDLSFSLSSIYNDIKKEAGAHPQKQAKKSVTKKLPDDLPEPKQVTYIPAATAFIKRYAALHGKVKTREQIISLVHGLQRAITEQRIRKDDPAINEIEKMQSELISLAAGMGESARIEIDDASLAHYKQIAKGEEVRTTVRLLKSFIAMTGKAVDRAKSSALLIRIEKAIDTVPYEDPYIPELKKAWKAIKQYAREKMVPIPAAALHGFGAAALRGHTGLGQLTGSGEPAVVRLLRNEGVKDLSERTLRKAFLNTCAPAYFLELAKAHMRLGILSMDMLKKPVLRKGLSGIEQTGAAGITEVDALDARLSRPKPSPQVISGLGGIETSPDRLSQASIPSVQPSSVSAKDLARMKFKTIGYEGKFKNVIGDPAIGFHMMVYGKPYQGKSSLVIELCKELAALNKGRIAYLALEEGISLSMQKKLIERGADNVEGLEFRSTMPPAFAGYGFVVIDSVSDRSISREHLRELFLQNQNTCFICIFHATKVGTPRGGLDFAHDMDIIIKVENHEPIVEKNRFL